MCDIHNVCINFEPDPRIVSYNRRMQNMHVHSKLRAGGFAHPRRNVAALNVQQGQRIADFGAGSGAYTLAIADRLGGTGVVYAIDVQRDLLRRIANEATRRGYRNVEVIWSDLEVPRASKLADHSMDLVLISNLLFQVPDKLPILREARRIIKGGGNVVIIDWADPTSAHSHGEGSIGPRKDDIINKGAALEFARKSGLEFVREFAAGAHHYGLIFRPIPISS